MALPGVCASCGRSAAGLFTCHVCRLRVCPNCVIEKTTFCKICKGVKNF